MKICPLLFTLTCCVSGMSQYPVAALNYQAEEGDDTTVEWRFSSTAGVSIASLKIHCVFVLPELKVFYHLDNSVEEAQHGQFAGRVQCDKEALRTGSVRLHLSSIRPDDSGVYLCRMVTASGRKVKQFSLNVTAATYKPTSDTPAPVRSGRSVIYVSLVAAAALLAVCVNCFSGVCCPLLVQLLEN